jgi:thiol-disulfide isomerase/thioredoxin
MKFLIVLSLIYQSLNLDFKKNSDIIKGRKSHSSRLRELESLDQVNENVESGRNIMILFYAEWCHHWYKLIKNSKEFLPKFQLASQYESTKDFDFFTVNCKNKEICDKYNVNKFPTTKVFLKGKDMNEEPPRDTESLLEFIDKVSSPPILLLEEKALRHFSNNYGEITFMILEEDEQSEFFQCVKRLAEDEYLPLLYFGHLNKQSFTTRSGKILKSPALIVN